MGYEQTTPTGWGPQDSVQLPYFSGFMVDITIVNRAYFMVYKPTNITGGPHPVGAPHYRNISRTLKMCDLLQPKPKESEGNLRSLAVLGVKDVV